MKYKKRNTVTNILFLLCFLKIKRSLVIKIKRKRVFVYIFVLFAVPICPQSLLVGVSDNFTILDKML